MVKNIILHFDEAIFNKIKEHKLKIQAQEKEEITWETYFKLLFDWRNSNK